MAFDRAAARRRVRAVTGWAAAGAAALTAGFAFGAARGSHAAHATAGSTRARSTLPDQAPPADRQSPYPGAPYGYDQGQTQGFAPPAASTAPPQTMSGGS